MMEQALLEENQLMMINIILEKEKKINQTQEQIEILMELQILMEEELNLLQEED